MSRNIPVKKNRNKKFNHKYKRFFLLKHFAKSFCFLLIFIIICIILTHYLDTSKTLTEYTQNNSDQPYKTSIEDTASMEDNTISTKDAATEDNTDIKADETNTTKDNEDIKADETTIVYSEISTNPERTTYQTGFYYEPLTDTVKQRITGISYPVSGCTVPYGDLNYVGLLYIDLNGETKQGELICNKAIAKDIVEIFYELYQNQYQIERIRLIDEYGGDDIASMKDNNTSCFNYRVIDGTTSLSNHSYGLAIDINPFYNPYVVFDRSGTGSTYISPSGSEIYADRSRDFVCKIDENDLCYRLFISHGFTWGGSWNSPKDYQHFEKKLD